MAASDTPNCFLDATMVAYTPTYVMASDEVAALHDVKSQAADLEACVIDAIKLSQYEVSDMETSKSYPVAYVHLRFVDNAGLSHYDLVFH